jgi:hypothetical protein
MGVAEYIDGIVSLLTQAGVPLSEIAENGTERLLAHAHMKGVDFEAAVLAAMKKHGVEVAE